ncbi:hypothetical protein B0A49_04629 [Cryomyces minteri]|uniref:EXPERA domain-containing protein n=1 Tax=Cryomyces minteri TaxID=331657 RepID=A0A4U0XG48_9PEZI|nr:hypothetical protein B0A49_04629 [Cryomyces minteri]
MVAYAVKSDFNVAPGGKYHSPVWVPYALYGTIDYIYGWPAYNAHNGFTAAQGTLNIVESIGYVVYLWIVYTHGNPANVKGLNEYFSGFENIGHNDPFTLFFMWIIPNGAWLVLPSYMMYVFVQEILQGLEAAVGEPKKRR